MINYFSFLSLTMKEVWSSLLDSISQMTHEEEEEWDDDELWDDDNLPFFHNHLTIKYK